MRHRHGGQDLGRVRHERHPERPGRRHEPRLPPFRVDAGEGGDVAGCGTGLVEDGADEPEDLVGGDPGAGADPDHHDVRRGCRMG